MRWLIALQSIVLVALLLIATLCLTLDKPEQLLQLIATRSHSERLSAIDNLRPTAEVAVIEKLVESERASLVGLSKISKFVHGIGEMLLLLAFLQSVALLLAAKTNLLGGFILKRKSTNEYAD